MISGQTALGVAPADTDEFLVSDAGVLKRIDYISTQASYDFDPGNGFVDQGGFGEFGGADPNDQQKLRSNIQNQK